MGKKKKKTAKAVEKKIDKKKQEIVDKIQEKKDKENKKILKIVKSEFEEPLATPIAEAVIVNKNLLKKDKQRLKEWQEEYFMSLFLRFKGLITDHNEAMEFKAEKLSADIDKKERRVKLLNQELGKLKEDVKGLKIEKGILVDA